MGLSLNVAFKKNVAPYGKIGSDYMAVGSALDRLDKLSTKHGLPTISQFHSVDPEEAAEMLGMTPEDLGLRPLEWFDAKLGLTAVRGLMKEIQANQKAVKGSVAILKDLEGIEAELIAAEKQRVRFHFAVLD